MIVVACQQFRARDLHGSHLFLYVSTKPVIEDSSGLVFAPYSACYPGIETHFAAASLHPANSVWSLLYDFTAVEAQKAGPSSSTPLGSAFSFAPYLTSPEEYGAFTSATEDGGLDLDPMASYVPATLSLEERDELVGGSSSSSEVVFVLLLGDLAHGMACRDWIDTVWEAVGGDAGVRIAATRAVDSLSAPTAAAMFASLMASASTLASLASSSGPVLGVWFVTTPTSTLIPSDAVPFPLASLLRSCLSTYAESVATEGSRRFSGIVTPTSFSALQAGETFFAPQPDDWQGQSL